MDMMAHPSRGFSPFFFSSSSATLCSSFSLCPPPSADTWWPFEKFFFFLTGLSWISHLTIDAFTIVNDWERARDPPKNFVFILFFLCFIFIILFFFRVLFFARHHLCLLVRSFFFFKRGGGQTLKKFLGATRRRRKKDNSRLWKAYYYVFINHRDAPMDSKGPHTHTHTVCMVSVCGGDGGTGSATGCAHQRWRPPGGKWVVSRGSQHNQGDSPRLRSSFQTLLFGVFFFGETLKKLY